MLERLYVVRTADKAAHSRPGFDERDVQLTELGHSQSLDLELWSHTTKVDAIFSSPMFRALQTVDGAAGVLDVPIRLEESLGPWYLPCAANTGIHPDHAPLDLLRRTFLRLSSKDSIGTPGSRLGETHDEMRDRVLSGLHAVISFCDDTDIRSALLVTRAAPAIIISSALGQKEALQDEPFETGGTRSFKRANDAADPLECWQFGEQIRYLKSAVAMQGPWCFDDVDLVPDTGVRERDGGTDVAALAFALMHQHSPLHKGHPRRPSIGRHETE